MIANRPCRWLRWGLPWLVVPAMAVAEPLTLADVDRLVAEDPSVQSRQAQALGYEEAAVAAGQLPDPQLSAEVMQFPADRPGFDTDEMTQVQIGLAQRFPRGQSRSMERQQQQALARAARAEADEQSRAVRLQARQAYLELVLAEQRLTVLEQSRRLFEDAAALREQTFAAGTDSQQDMLRAELELERLEDRIDAARNARNTARARLSRWIGPEVQRPLPEEGFPELPELTRTDLSAHPSLAARRAQVQASEEGIGLAEQGYRPEWRVQVGYGLRTNSDVRNRHRLGAMVSVDLPLFTAQRQDRTLAARRAEREAALQRQDQTQRELEQAVDSARDDLESLQRREARYRDRLLGVADANAEAADKAYSAGTATFTELVDARLLALETQLEVLDLTAARKQAQARLLSLLGEEAL